MCPKPFVFMMLMVIALLPSCQPASAVKRITLFRHKMTLKADSRNLIPCMFYPDHAIDPAVLQLEWGKIPVGGGEYTPLIHLSNGRVQTFHDNSRKYQLFVSLVPSGNCTLVIDDTDTSDGGTYELWMSVNKVVYKPASKIKIDILDDKKPSSRALWSDIIKTLKDNLKGEAETTTNTPITTDTPITTTTTKTTSQTPTTPTAITTPTPTRATIKAPTTTTTTSIMTSTEPAVANSDAVERALVISVMVIGPILVITSIISGVGIYMYVTLRKKRSSRDVENPEVSTLASQPSSTCTVQIENETQSDGEEECEEEEETNDEECEEEETNDEECEEEEETNDEEGDEEETEEEETENI
ncbi:microtubule-associated protein RP/EB family member 1-like [Xenopus laevis]|uniref:Microtubule-associated protein RP/EB family member 1-like n=1 Tax=Xenopus laevis TaxID=8355 RepID=A0A8J1KZK6_XENLA|nr:microtubule-associated protein RP/EB family member 1-like [Xenopus laevis]